MAGRFNLGVEFEFVHFVLVALSSLLNAVVANDGLNLIVSLSIEIVFEKKLKVELYILSRSCKWKEDGFLAA